MLISVRWIEELLRVDDAATVTPQHLAETLTSLGLEVEGIESFGEGLESIVVAEVVTTAPHPGADRLKLVELNIGNGALTVVCGASNVPNPGGKIAFAPVGTTLPDGLTLVERKVRGVLSCGMICSADELGIGPDTGGILILPTEFETGRRLVELVPEIVDTVIEIAVTPNRPDALGHLGVARDLATKLRGELVLAPIVSPEAIAETQHDASLVKLNAPQCCGRYKALGLTDVTVGESPLRMQVRLHRVGLRAINNVVDVTNYVLMECGQPSHTFDRGKLAGGGVIVRMAVNDEPMKALDDTDLTLREDDLVIADASRPQALAGVMGGADSVVDADTKTVLFEMAWFNPSSTRLSARAHKIHSDSSHRFERGVDAHEVLDYACGRALRLLADSAGATLLSHADVRGESPQPIRVTLRPATIARVLGMTIPVPESERILNSLGISVDTTDPNAWRCVCPTFRPDLRQEIDLVEEVMRHFGVEHLPDVSSKVSLNAAGQTPVGNPSRPASDTLAAALRESGYSEAVTFAFTSEDLLRPFSNLASTEELVRLKNPMREQTAVMRTHLLPGLLEAVKRNKDQNDYDCALFEIGRTYAWPKERPTTEGPTAEIDAKLPVEREVAAFVLRGAGSSLSRLVETAVAAVTRLGMNCRIVNGTNANQHSFLHPGVQATVVVLNDDGSERAIGMIGEIHPQLLKDADLEDEPVFYGQFDVDSIPALHAVAYRGFSRLPATSRDVSFDMPVTLPTMTLVEAILRAGDTVCGESDIRLGSGNKSSVPVEIIEDYRGEGISDGRRALLMRLHYRAPDRSVKVDEVQALHDKIVGSVCERLSQGETSVHRR